MDQLVELIGRYGVIVLFVNVLLEQVGLPIPALPTLVLVGALVADGKLSVMSSLAAALVASLLADYAWYAVGRRLGFRVLRSVCRLSVSPESCVRQTAGFFERFGLLSLVIAKFIPGYSTVAPPLAGILGTGTLPFLIFNTAGALLWAGLPIAIGALFHDTVGSLIQTLDGLGALGVPALAVGLCLYVVIRWVRLVQFQRVLQMARIPVEELRTLLDEGRDPLILDVRTHLAYRCDPRMIPGAIRFHLDELDEKLAGIPREQEIILYCT